MYERLITFSTVIGYWVPGGVQCYFSSENKFYFNS